MKNRSHALFWNTRYRAAAWIVPVLVMGAVLHLGILPMVTEIRGLQSAIAEGKQNVFEQAWLDSVLAVLESGNSEMNGYMRNISERVSRTGSLQEISDEVRQVFSGAGLTVMKIRPALVQKPSLSQVSIRVTGSADFASLMSLFSRLYNRESRFSIEKMTVRKTRTGLSFAISLTSWAVLTGRQVVIKRDGHG